MASTTELIRGYRFELAGSIQFPCPTRSSRTSSFASCPIYEPEVQSASIGERRTSRRSCFYSDPERLLEHLGETLGIDAVLGMAEVAAWAEAPARAIGRFDVRQAAAGRSTRCGRAPPTRPSARPSAPPCSAASWTWSTGTSPTRRSTRRSAACSASCPSTPPSGARYSPGSALCLAFALASPGDGHHVQGAGRHRHHVRPPVRHVRAQRWRAAPPRQGLEDRRRRTAASAASSSATASVVTAPVVVSNLDPTATFTQLLDSETLPDAFARRVDAIDHRAAYFQIHFALSGLPEYRGPYEVLNEHDLRPQRHVLRHGGADAGRLRGLRARPGARVAVVQPADPLAATTRAWRPTGKHAASSFAFYLPDRRPIASPRLACATRWPSGSWPRSPRRPRTSRTSSSASSTIRPTPTS